MKVLDKLYKASIGKVLTSVRGIVDDTVTSTEERQELNNKLTKHLEAELSQRALNDSKDGSWLSRNIRPMSLLIILFFFILMAFIDSLNGIDIPDKYTLLLANWGKMIMAFYFTSRGIEKTIKSLRR